MWPEELFLAEKDPGNTVPPLKKVEPKNLEEVLEEEDPIAEGKSTFKIY
jgi:hypothetical protein